jgi:hypothetical protein
LQLPSVLFLLSSPSSSLHQLSFSSPHLLLPGCFFLSSLPSLSSS